MAGGPSSSQAMQTNQIVSGANHVVVSRTTVQETSPQSSQLPKGAQPVRIGQNATITLAGSGQSQQLQIQNPSGQQLIPVSIGGQLFTIANPSAIAQSSAVQHQTHQISPRKEFSHVTIRAPVGAAIPNSALNNIQSEQQQQQQCVTLARTSYQAQKGQVVQIHGQNNNPNVVAIQQQQQQQQQQQHQQLLQQRQQQQQQQHQLQSQATRVQEIQLSGGQKAIVIPNNHLPQLQISGLNNLGASAQGNQISQQAITLSAKTSTTSVPNAVAGSQASGQASSPQQNSSSNAKSSWKVTSSRNLSQSNSNNHFSGGNKFLVKSLKNDLKVAPAITISCPLTSQCTSSAVISPTTTTTTTAPITTDNVVTETRHVEPTLLSRAEPIESITQLKMKKLQEGQQTVNETSTQSPKVLSGIHNIALSPCLKSEIKQEASECTLKRLRSSPNDDSDSWLPLQQHQRNATHCGIVVPSAPNIPPLSPSPPAMGDSADERPSSTQSVETDESKDTQQQGTS